MWLSKAVQSAAMVGALLGASVLSGCSFSPVYSGALAAQPSLALSYAKPTSRLEQVIYQELSLRLGSSASGTAPLTTVTVVPVVGDLALSRTDNPSKPMEASVTATLTITPRDGSGKPVKTFTRRATANYTRNGQVLADVSAQEEALERAAKAAAESLRLAVLADLSR
jgi:hypothetical protein